MKKIAILIGIVFQSINVLSQDKLIEQKVESLLTQMTLKEKIGQLPIGFLQNKLQISRECCI